MEVMELKKRPPRTIRLGGLQDKTKKEFEPIERSILSRFAHSVILIIQRALRHIGYQPQGIGEVKEEARRYIYHNGKRIDVIRTERFRFGR